MLRLRVEEKASSVSVDACPRLGTSVTLSVHERPTALGRNARLSMYLHWYVLLK